MAEHGVAALSHPPSGERVRTGPADPSGAWDQDHPPSTETTTQESGLRENRTSRLSERTEEGRKPDPLRLYSDEADEQRRAAGCGAGGAKGGGQGEGGTAKHAPGTEPGTEPGKRVPGAGPHTASRKAEEEGTVHRTPPPPQPRPAPDGVPGSQADRSTWGGRADMAGLRGRP